MHFPLFIGAWLEDLHIDEAQAVLLQEHKSVNGLQQVGVFAGGLIGASVVTPNHPFTQILNIEGAHWICVSSVGCRSGQITVYDSMVSASNSLPLTTQCQLAWLTYGSHRQLCVNFANVTRQIGSGDCGLYAIAYATALVSGLDPTQVHFDQKNMRGHLINCLKNRHFTQFPSKPRTLSGTTILSNQVIPLSCLCRMPRDKVIKDVLTIKCTSGCNELLHRSCLTLTRSGHFTCPVCTLKQKM